MIESANFIKKRPNTGVFLQIVRKFYEQLFYTAPLVAASGTTQECPQLIFLVSFLMT